MDKAIRIRDKKFHARVMRKKIRHGFSSVEAMLKAWERKVYGSGLLQEKKA